jgi:hypothetical protein
MAVDATGAPTSLGIPKFDTAADNPSGKGTNAMMDAVNTLLVARIPKPASPTAGQALVWDSGTSSWLSAFVKPSQLAQEGATDGQYLKWDNGLGKYVPSTFTATIAPSNITQGGATNGQVLEWTGAAWVPSTISQAGTQIDRKLLTADVTGITATTEAGATTIITSNSVAYDGSEVKIEVFLPGVVAVSGTGQPTGVIVRDPAGTPSVVGQFLILKDLTTNGWAIKAEAFDTPSAGSHVYALKAFAPSGASPNWTIKAGVGGSGNLLNGFLRTTQA